MAQHVAGKLYESIAGLLFDLGRQLRQPNGYPFDAMKLKKSLQDAIEGRFMDGVASSYPLSVNYDMSAEDAVKLGRYYRENTDISSHNFPTKRTGMTDLTIELIHFDRVISTTDAQKTLDKMGYRPAELHELLAFGEKHPNVQREFPIVALGSVWQHRYGDHLVPCLYKHSSRRHLHLRQTMNDWRGIYRFAAVRK